MALQQYTNREYYEEGLGNGLYQVVKLDDIINQFQIAYTGEDKIIPKAKRSDIAFHAQRALAELSYDTLPSCKAMEFTVPNSLQMVLPIDYVNYTQLAWIDSSGIKHRIYRENKSSNPGFVPYQNDDGDFKLDIKATITEGSNLFVLDGDFRSHIIIGMKFGAHPLLDAKLIYVHGISYDPSTDKTTVTVKNKQGGSAASSIPKFPVGTPPGTTADIDLNIQRQNIIARESPGKNTYVETTLAANANIGEQILQVADASGLEVGMYVSHPSFPNEEEGTGSAAKIVGISGNYIEFSKEITYAATSGETIGFIKAGGEGSTTFQNYKSNAPSENFKDDYIDDTYYPLAGNRYGLEPERAQVNGYFHLCGTGKIHFSSNLAGQTVVLDYISDRLSNSSEMVLHKFAEEAVYKSIAYAILSTKANTQEYIVRRFKKEKFAAVRSAKIRLSNIKLEEITQILRGKSKRIKH